MMVYEEFDAEQEIYGGPFFEAHICLYIHRLAIKEKNTVYQYGLYQTSRALYEAGVDRRGRYDPRGVMFVETHLVD